MQKERIRAVLALLGAADNLMVQAEGEGQNDKHLLRATTKARTVLNQECGRLLRVYEEAR